MNREFCSAQTVIIFKLFEGISVIFGNISGESVSPLNSLITVIFSLLSSRAANAIFNFKLFTFIVGKE